MRSAVADEMRAKVRERILSLTPSERAELAQLLGGEALASSAATHDVSPASARPTPRSSEAKPRKLRPKRPRKP